VCSYNGIIFNIKCKGPYEIHVLSVHVAGMLGRVVSSLSPLHSYCVTYTTLHYSVFMLEIVVGTKESQQDALPLIGGPIVKAFRQLAMS
jgi:hypothetical protein